MASRAKKSAELPGVISAIRQRSGKNKTAFGKLLNVSHVTVIRYESGEQTPGQHPLLVLFSLAQGHERRVIRKALRKVLNLEKAPTEKEVREGIDILAKVSSELAKSAAQTPFETRAHRFVTEALLIANVAQTSPEDYPSETITEILSLWRRHQENPASARVFERILGYLEVQLNDNQPTENPED